MTNRFDWNHDRNGTKHIRFMPLIILDLFTKKMISFELEKQTKRMSPIDCINVASFERNLDL